MKWPAQLDLIRHGESAYNILKAQKANDKTYQRFKAAFNKNPRSLTTKILAHRAKNKFSLPMGDWSIPLTEVGHRQAYDTGLKLRYLGTDLPDIVYISPYKRTMQTYEGIIRGWPELANVNTFLEERVREQEVGLATLTGDWLLYYALYPDQHVLYQREGNYWFQNPQGENVPMVRQRVYSWIDTIMQDYHDQHVMAITHQITILSLRANLERWDHNQFNHHRDNDTPINCGITTYRGAPELGSNGRFILENYNQKFY